MAGRELEAMTRAVARYLAGENVSQAALAEGVSREALRCALNRRGIEKRGPVKGPDHHAYIDGRKAARLSPAK